MTNLAEYWDDVDTASVEVSSGRPDPIPAGDYLIQMVSQEIKPTKDGTGITLQCQYKVVEGEYENRVIFGNFNIRNRSAQAQTIGIGQFKGLCQVCGIEFEDAKHDASILLHVPFLAKIGFGKTTDQYPDPKNEIKAFKLAASSPPAGKSQPTKPSTSATGVRSMPWKDGKKTAA